MIQFSASNKWPNEVHVIRALQAAFYKKLFEILEKDFKLVCRAHPNYLDVLKDGYVFRLRISNTNEISAVKRQFEDDGVVAYCDNEESLNLERTLVHLPVLTSAIHG